MKTFPIANIIDEGKVFGVKINNKPFKIDRYTNLAYFGNVSFKELINLKKAKEQQENISNIINELEKKIDIKKEVIHLAKKIRMI